MGEAKKSSSLLPSSVACIGLNPHWLRNTVAHRVLRSPHNIQIIIIIYVLKPIRMSFLQLWWTSGKRRGTYTYILHFGWTLWWTSSMHIVALVIYVNCKGGKQIMLVKESSSIKMCMSIEAFSSLHRRLIPLFLLQYFLLIKLKAKVCFRINNKKKTINQSAHIDCPNKILNHQSIA